jgi:hypothetical protein
MSWLVPGWTDRTWAKESRLLPFVAVSAGWVSQAIADRAKDEGAGDIDDVKALIDKGVDKAKEGYKDIERDKLDELIKKSTQQSE